MGVNKNCLRTVRLIRTPSALFHQLPQEGAMRKKCFVEHNKPSAYQFYYGGFFFKSKEKKSITFDIVFQRFNLKKSFKI